MGRFVPLSIPNFEGNERKYVDDAVAQGWVSTGGAYITEFEKRLAAFLHTDNVAACQSGTSALHLSLVEAGVRPGDTVLVPPVTFIAAVNPVKYQFAKPVFIDCDDSLCMDPVKLKRFCEEECAYQNGRLIHKDDGSIVKAIVIVHIFGNMADMEAIMDIAQTYNLKVIEDATEALGTYYTEGRYAGKYAGTIGDFGAYSFNGNKIITTGGGGAITSCTSKEADRIRYLSTQAKDDPHFYIHNDIGYNYRMTNVQAALGVAQMEELESFIERKHKMYEWYQEMFADLEIAQLLPFRPGTHSNQWFYSLKIDRARVSASLREIIGELERRGVQTRAIWGLINEQLPYLQDKTFELEKAPYYADCILNIPASTNLTREDIQFAAGEIRTVLEKFACQ